MADIFDIFKKIESQQKTTGPVTHLIVGLGNPGPNYENTRHNAGFLCVDYLAKKYDAPIKNSKFQALVSETTISGKRVLLMKPQTFMNLSGEAVSQAAHFYKIPPENILVLCDDVNFDVGFLRIRLQGSHGGHNGLKNIEAQLSSDRYIRFKIGVGKKPTKEYDLADWVLGKFPKDHLETITNIVAPQIEQSISLILEGKSDIAMNRYSK